MHDTETRPNIFRDWLDEMDISPDQAAHLLGKSPRMVDYYREGRDVPRDTLLLMDALAQGYRPRLYGRQR